MTGFVPMLGKEFTEILRTWRIWLVGILFVAFAVADPVIAKFTPEILGSVVGDQLPIELPAATYLDAYGQWIKDLSQLLLVVVLVVAAGTVAAEANSGTLIMPLTKPISRSGFVLAKLAAVLSLVTVALAVATGAVCLVTGLVFDDVDYAPIWRAVGVWWVFAIMLIAATVAASCLVSNTIAAFGIGFGVFIAFSVVSVWQPARAYSPAGLPEVMGLLGRGEPADAAWPVGTALLLAAAFVAVAVLAFRRREL